MPTLTNLPRYSPSWSSGAFAPRILTVPDVPTRFDDLVHRLGLEKRPDLWPYNEKLCKYAKKHHKRAYVPEWFLEELGLDGGGDEL